METCFLTSKSFSNSAQLGPSIKTNLFSCRKEHAFFRNCKLGYSSQITRCELRSSSSNEDEIKPIISGDWRSFRAKLVAVERTRSDDPSSLISGIDAPKLAIGDKWVHPIHEPEKGCLLIATEKLDGVPIFERTVILLLSTGPIGPSGIIVNRPSLMSIKETKSTVLDLSGTFSDRPLFYGGPLKGGLFLVSSPNDKEDAVGTCGVFEEVMKGLHYGTKETVGCAAEMVKRNMVGLDDIKFFDGYSGWDKDQLQEEIRAGYWTVAACSPSVLGLESLSGVEMWGEILGLMGPRKVW